MINFIIIIIIIIIIRQVVKFGRSCGMETSVETTKAMKISRKISPGQITGKKRLENVEYF
jgi:hypothetical protein